MYTHHGGARAGAAPNLALRALALLRLLGQRGLHARVLLLLAQQLRAQRRDLRLHLRAVAARAAAYRVLMRRILVSLCPDPPSNKPLAQPTEPWRCMHQPISRQRRMLTLC